MLTEKEADQLLRDFGKDCVLDAGCNCIIKWRKLVQVIKDFTEKPKREIQVGDIYKDIEKKSMYLITFIDDELNEIYATHDLQSNNKTFHYNKNGIYQGGLGCYDLDLSKRYKFVEVENAD